mgnify:CR=1 FL=1
MPSLGRSQTPELPGQQALPSPLLSSTPAPPSPLCPPVHAPHLPLLSPPPPRPPLYGTHLQAGQGQGEDDGEDHAEIHAGFKPCRLRAHGRRAPGGKQWQPASGSKQAACPHRLSTGGCGEQGWGALLSHKVGGEKPL